MTRIAITGSGLAAVSVAKVLIKRGVKPVILDIGDELDENRKNIVSRLSNTTPDNWKTTDRDYIAENLTIHNKNSLPMKLAFGSNYFYASDCQRLQTKSDGILPPHSHAKGGFSVGWGATALPASDCDLLDWPIDNKILEPYYKNILAELPYSASDDRLSQHFPVFSEDTNSIRLTPGNISLLKDMESSFDKSNRNLTFGQARTLVRPSDYNNLPGCKYCGYCMSGCVYGCIYKSSQDIDQMISNNSIEYVSGVIVNSLNENNNIVEITLTNNKKSETLIFDRVFLAAGAVGSTRIVMSSKNIYEQELRLQSTVGFLAPMFRTKRSPFTWPKINTQPGIFLEYKVNNLSDHWVHTQLSTPNELVYEKLKIKPESSGILNTFKKLLTEHLILAHCNMHSDHANGYFLKLEKSINGNGDKLISRREEIQKPHIAIKQATKQLSSIARKVGCYTLLPLVQDSIQTGGFHVGGTLPMSNKPEKANDTNLLGNPKNWDRIHVVDSSIFPSLPGTTIGLLAMANATRIASEVELI